MRRKRVFSLMAASLVGCLFICIFIVTVRYSLHQFIICLIFDKIKDKAQLDVMQFSRIYSN